MYLVHVCVWAHIRNVLVVYKSFEEPTVAACRSCSSMSCPDVPQCRNDSRAVNQCPNMQPFAHRSSSYIESLHRLRDSASVICRRLLLDWALLLLCLKQQKKRISIRYRVKALSSTIKISTNVLQLQYNIDAWSAKSLNKWHFHHYGKAEKTFVVSRF